MSPPPPPSSGLTEPRFRDALRNLPGRVWVISFGILVNQLGNFLPVFIVLYQVLRGLTMRQPSLGFNTGWVSGQLGLGVGDIPSVPDVERTFDPAYVNHNSELYKNLSNTTEMTAFGLDLSESASQALSQGVLHALPYLLLIASSRSPASCSNARSKAATLRRRSTPSSR